MNIEIRDVMSILLGVPLFIWNDSVAEGNLESTGELGAAQ